MFHIRSVFLQTGALLTTYIRNIFVSLDRRVIIHPQKEILCEVTGNKMNETTRTHSNL